MRFDSILETVGNTPVVRINKLAPPNVNLYVKIEAFNPLGSVKDRLALGVIEDAEKTGELKPGQTVIEATSGNTGIGLAMVCAAKGYPLVVTMADSFSVERRKLMRFLGAKVVLTPAAERGTGMVKKATALAKKNGWFLTRQFENEANADMHSRTTAREIINDFAGERLDFWVTGFGTGGTLKGVGARAREGAAGDEDRGGRAGRSADAHERDGAAAERRWLAGRADIRRGTPHPIQGWSPDFIPKLTGDAIAAKYVDRIITVPAPEAMQGASSSRRRKGSSSASSSGGTFARRDSRSARTRLTGSTVLCHVARHRRAIPQHAAVRRHSGRHDGGRAGDRADAGGHVEMSEPAAYPYATHLDVLFPPLEKIELDPLVAAVRDQWYNQTLARINDSVVRLGVMEGELSLAPARR